MVQLSTYAPVEREPSVAQICPTCQRPTRSRTGYHSECRPQVKRSWQDAKYRERRDVLYARTDVCEWCKEPFDGSDRELRRNLHHLIERYETPDGEPDRAAYEALRDEDVVIIHARCHRAWHRFGVRPPDTRLVCPTCGKWKPPRFAKCAPCALTEPGRRCACGALKDPRQDRCIRCFSSAVEEFSSAMDEIEAEMASGRRPAEPGEPGAEDLPRDDGSGT